MEIREQLERLLSNQISLSEFSRWFVPYAWHAHIDSDPDAAEFAEEIDDLLVEYDGDCEELRAALKSLYDSSLATPTAKFIVTAEVSPEEAPLLHIQSLVGLARSLPDSKTQQANTAPIREMELIA